MPNNKNTPHKAGDLNRKHTKEAKDAYPYEPKKGWEKQASCRGVGPSLFFIERGESSYPALEVCGPCPVRIDCFYDGLGEPKGIWGGTTERARRSVKIFIKKQGGTWKEKPRVFYDKLSGIE